MNPIAWIPLLALLFLMGIALQAQWLIYFSTTVLLVFGAAHFWAIHVLDRVSYRRRFRYRRGFPGEESHVSIEISNQKILPLSWIKTEDPWALQVSPTDETLLAPSPIEGEGWLVNVANLRWFGKINRHFTLRFGRRGIYSIGDTRIYSGDLFGLSQREGVLSNREFLTVFPALLPYEMLGLQTEDPFGETQAKNTLFEDPTRFIGIRPYHPEDGFRRIHWAATARSGQLQSKILQPVSTRTLAVCLNLSTSEQFWLGYSSPLLEKMISAAATLCYYGIQHRYSVGLYANGCLANADQPFRIQPGETQQHLAHLLEALAGITPYIPQSFEAFLTESLSHIPFGTTLLIITAILSDRLAEMLIRLRTIRRQMVLYKVGEAPHLTLPGIRTIHIP